MNGSDVAWYPKTIGEDKLGGNLKGTIRVCCERSCLCVQLCM